MPLYRLCAEYVSRGQGRSFAGAMSYRIGERLYCAYDGKLHDYRQRRDIVHSEVLLPPNAPHDFLDAQTFCDAVEMAEKRKDARIAREILIALPRELSFDTDIALAREFIRECFVAEGMCAVLAIHRGDSKKMNRDANSRIGILPHNPHAHILLATRPVGPDGFESRKNRDWDKSEYLISWREQWANIQNKLFLRKGLAVSVSHESHAKQEKNREATHHLGPALSAMERRGIRTHLGNENRAIEKRNKDKEREEQSRQCQIEQDRGYSR